MTLLPIKFCGSAGNIYDHPFSIHLFIFSFYNSAMYIKQAAEAQRQLLDETQ